MTFGGSLLRGNEDHESGLPHPQQQQQPVLRRSTTLKEALTSDKTTTSPKAVRNSFWRDGLPVSLVLGWDIPSIHSLKVWVQTGSKPTVNSATKGGPLATLRLFYAGVSGPVVAVGMIQSLNFTAYDTTRRFWYYHFDAPPDADPTNGDYLRQDSYTSVAVAGVTAGTVVSLVTAPMLQIKTLQQTQRLKYNEAFARFRQQPYRGFPVHLAFETLNQSIGQCTFVRTNISNVDWNDKTKRQVTTQCR